MSDERTIFQKIGDAVVDFAPGIATVLAATGVGAPVAAAVGAVGALGRAFGLGSTAKPEEVLTAISADPEIRLKAMIAENDFKLKMREQDLLAAKEETERMRLELADTQSARTRDTARTQAGQKNARADILIAMAFIVVVIIYVIIAYFGESKIGMLLVGSMLTTVGTFVQKIGTAYDFEFGSSRGSVQKTENAAEAARELASLAAKGK